MQQNVLFLRPSLISYEQNHKTILQNPFYDQDNKRSHISLTFPTSHITNFENRGIAPLNITEKALPLLFSYFRRGEILTTF